MENRVLSIECGRSLVRVLEVSCGGRETKIYNSFLFSTPNNMFEQNDSEEFASVLQAELKRRKITTKKVVFVINSSRMATREVIIPAVKESRIDDLISANASEYFPVDISQYVLVHEIIEKFTEGETKKYRLNVLAIPRDIIEFYECLARDIGLSLYGMGYTGNASKLLMQGESAEGIRALLKIDGRSSILTIMDGDRIELQRHISYGVSEAVSIVCENGMYGRPDFASGLEVLYDNNLLFDEAVDANGDGIYEDYEVIKSNAEYKIKEDVTESLRMLSGSVARILDYYLSRIQGIKIEKIDVIGIGAEIKGFMEFLTSEFGIHTEKMPPLRTFHIVKNEEEVEKHLAAYYSCIGVTLKGGLLPAINKRRLEASSKSGGGEATTSIGALVIPSVISAVFVIGAAAWFILAYFDYNSAKEKNASLNTQITAYSYIEEVEKANLIAKADYDWMSSAVKLTESNNNGLKSLIEELERRMPSEIRVLSFNALPDRISLNITVSNKEAVADIIKRMREINNVIVTNVSTISETKGKDDRVEVNFSLDVIYINTDAGKAAEDAVKAEDSEVTGVESTDNAASEGAVTGTAGSDTTASEGAVTEAEGTGNAATDNAASDTEASGGTSSATESGKGE